MAFELPSLPWPEDALAPVISAETIGFHHGKHHRAYVDNLTKLVAGTDLEGKALEEVIGAAAGDPGKAGIFNNAAQIWNHTFFWKSLKPGGGGAPTGAVAAKIDAAFGGYDAFAEQFKTAAVGRFGSGWAWLVAEGDGVKIVTTPNAEMPVPPAQKPLLVVDVWEHAYYLDYQNRRPDWVQAFFDKLVDWELVAKNLG